MPHIHITGWRYGLKKVSLTRLLQATLSRRLHQAKADTDRILAGEHVVLSMDDMAQAQQLVQQLHALGVHVTLEA